MGYCEGVFYHAHMPIVKRVSYSETLVRGMIRHGVGYVKAYGCDVCHMVLGRSKLRERRVCLSIKS